MFFYAVGSLLFAFALFAALAVIIAMFRHHGAQMRTALANLSLDSAYAPATKTAPASAARKINDRSQTWLTA